MLKLKSKLIVDKRIQSGTRDQPKYLTGIDIFNAHVGIPVIMSYPQGFDVALVERALLETLKHYPDLTGRIKKDPQGQQYLDCNDAGVAFRVHQCEGTTPVYGIHTPVGKVFGQYHKRVLPWQVVNKDMPLIQVEVFQFADGGIILSCLLVHSLMDGSAFWRFMQNWSKVCMGQTFEQSPLDRNLINAMAARHEQTMAPGLPKGLVTRLSLGQMIPLFARFGFQAATTMKKGVFRIPASRIAQWKLQARQEMPDVTSEVSSGALATAHCLKVLSPLMTSPKDRCVGIVLDLRFKRQLNIPSDYVGNALGFSEVRYTRADIERLSVPVLASTCKPTAEHLSTERQANFMGLMERFRAQKAIWKLFWTSAAETLDAGLIMNNCMHFPVYQIDFGRGGPVWHDLAPVAFRMLMVFQTPEMDGGVDLHLTASAKELEAFGESCKAL